MPANTPNGLPYPVGTDRLADGDDAIKALAQALDPAWTNLALNAGWTPRAGSVVPAYRVIAGVVHLRGSCQKGTALAQGDNPVTLPADARPSAVVSVALGISRSSGSGVATARMDVQTTGATALYFDPAASTWVAFDGATFSK